MPGEALHGETIKTSPGPGNVVSVELTSQHVTEVITGFGERGVSAKAVANSVVKAAREYIAAEVVAGEYLADQLLLPFALAGGGAFTTLPLSKHSTTNMDVIQKFLDVKFEVTTLSNRAVQIRLCT